MQPCKPRAWHNLHHVWPMSLYVLDHEQILSFYKYCSFPFVVHLYISLWISVCHSASYCWWVICILGYGLYIFFIKVLKIWIVIPSVPPCGSYWWRYWLLILGFSSEPLQDVCHQLLLFSLANQFDGWLLVHKYILYTSIHCILFLYFKMWACMGSSDQIHVA